MAIPTMGNVGTDTCDRHGSGWMFRLNEYVISGQEIKKRPDQVDANHTCSKNWNRHKIIESEFSLTAPNEKLRATKRVVGDVCSTQPTLVLDYIRYGIINEQNKTSKNIGTLPPYDFYVSWQNDPTKRGYLNKVERALIEFAAITKKQCQKIPETVRVVARANYTSNNPDRLGRMPKDAQYEYEQFYSGTFYPNAQAITLIHDDQKTAALYTEYAQNRSISLHQQKNIASTKTTRRCGTLCEDDVWYLCEQCMQ